MLLMLSTASYANYEANDLHEGWLTRDEKPVQNTGNMKIIKGFCG